jgi:methionine synthase II (cobalamin-independent)
LPIRDEVDAYTQLYETLTSANAAVIAISEPAMRLAVARTVLDEVIKKAGQTKEELANT